MTLWIEIVCDRCAIAGPGSTAYERRVSSRLARDARARGWKIGPRTGDALCPDCKGDGDSPYDSAADVDRLGHLPAAHLESRQS